MRNLEEETHLKFYDKAHTDSKKIHFDYTLEQPTDAVFWLTRTLDNIKRYYETMFESCRTGLKASLVKIGGLEIFKLVVFLHRQLRQPDGFKLVLAAKTRQVYI